MGKWVGTPKLWRIRGRASDGVIVTLGRYETEVQAQADLTRFERENQYRKLHIEALEPPPAPPEATHPPATS